MKFKNIFSSGKMSKDLDERLVQKGEYRDALNVKVANSSGSDVGSVENEISNAVLSSLSMGNNPVCIGSVADDVNNKIYWFVRSDLGSYVCEYDSDNNAGKLAVAIGYVEDFSAGDFVTILPSAWLESRYFVDDYTTPVISMLIFFGILSGIGYLIYRKIKRKKVISEQ